MESLRKLRFKSVYAPLHIIEKKGTAFNQFQHFTISFCVFCLKRLHSTFFFFFDFNLLLCKKKCGSLYYDMKQNERKRLAFFERSKLRMQSRTYIECL